MEPGEQVRSVQPWVVLAQPLEPEGALLAGAWHVVTGRGNGYRGGTVAVVEGDGGSATVTRLASGAVRMRRDGDRVAVEAGMTATELIAE